MITTAQAERESITRLQLGRLVEQGVLQRARRGVYLLPSSQYGRFVDICSAWVALDPGLYPDERRESPSLIVASHESAASLHHIGDLIPHKHSFSAVKRKQTPAVN
ncbi:type IV toxin-antitoxin system AbiEi family antitoxin domain-containing protein [Corynebacterium cystitidis]|uniref:type IV toxin-antitoxin system AbiEi family antitoxin domain-containing protein n=1 Tax=Corynebacterium cystitidis TaxID=35757 RepID=UPI00358DD2E3